METVISGAPQGSILGPLFSIYINDLPYGIYHTAKPIIYADDTSVLITVKNVNELQVKAKTTLDYMSERFNFKYRWDRPSQIQFRSLPRWFISN